MNKHWPLSENFRIRLTMESDWHVGSGMGRPGSVDRLIARDADDLPFVPAKTLRGIWRDACERLCFGLDNGQVGAWSKLVDHLFGSQPALGEKDPTGRHSDPTQLPIESSVQIRSARIAESLRQRLGPLPESECKKNDKNFKIQKRQRELFRQTLTFVKPGVKIDRRSGSAQTDMLRFEEMGRKGTILEAECRLNIPDDGTRQLASALLIASAKLVEWLGGKRRRGPGRCRLEIIDADVEKAIDWLQTNQNPQKWQESKNSDTNSSESYQPVRDDSWICAPLTLHLQGPLSVSYRTTGNVVETLDFVLGSYLLPHVTQKIPQLRPSVAAGDVVILPAYPEVDGERGQPVPMALFTPKGLDNPLQAENRDQVVNRLLQAEPTDGAQLKQMREGYVSTRPTKVYKTPITVRTHNTVADHAQRPDESVGGVYSYEAIAPSDQGETVILRSELRVRKTLVDRLGADWWNRLDGEVSLGRSRKDDYGSVYLKAESPGEWKPQKINTESDLYVWLVSDTLLRNSRLRAEPTAACLGEELSRRLGVKLNVRGDKDIKESIDGEVKDNANKLLHEMVRIRRFDTWHVGWGLPRPSLVALQAGSCMVFEVEGTIDPAKLAQLEASGVGERTAEGYGLVRFNHPLITVPLIQSAHTSATVSVNNNNTNTKSITSNDPAFKFARLIETECWKQEIRRACLEATNDRTRRKELVGLELSETKDQGWPSMSQLGSFRSQYMRVKRHTTQPNLLEAELRQVLSWFEHLAIKERQRTPRWRNNAIQKIRGFLEDRDRIWTIIEAALKRMLNDSEETVMPSLTANAVNELKRDLWALAVRTFFDACIRAHKRELEPEQNRQETAHGT